MVYGRGGRSAGQVHVATVPGLVETSQRPRILVNPSYVVPEPLELVAKFSNRGSCGAKHLRVALAEEHGTRPIDDRPKAPKRRDFIPFDVELDHVGVVEQVISTHYLYLRNAGGVRRVVEAARVSAVRNEEPGATSLQAERCLYDPDSLLESIASHVRTKSRNGLRIGLDRNDDSGRSGGSRRVKRQVANVGAAFDYGGSGPDGGDKQTTEISFALSVDDLASVVEVADLVATNAEAVDLHLKTTELGTEPARESVHHTAKTDAAES
jgi:hypothetical protein